MMRPALVALSLASASCLAQTAEQRRDLVIQSALDSARAACLMLQADKSIGREPGVDAWCDGVVNGCGATK